MLHEAPSCLAQQNFPPAENVWIAPTDDDVRSPCPFINTLANHGFINRSGKGVDLFGMVEELSGNFDVKRTLFDKLAAGAISLNFTYTDADGITRLDIDQLFAHNKQEHDASFVRADEYFGKEESKLVDPMLLSSFLNDTSPDSETLSKEDIMSFQTARIQDSFDNNPEVMIVAKQTTSFSAQATLWLVFGQEPNLTSVNKEKLREFLTFERFPEGYAPLSLTSNGTFVPHDVIAEGTLASDIRLEFVENFENLLALNAPATSMPTTAMGTREDSPTAAPASSGGLAAIGIFTMAIAVIVTFGGI